MTMDEQAATSEVINIAPTTLPRSVRHRIFVYLGILITRCWPSVHPHGGADRNISVSSAQNGRLQCLASTSKERSGQRRLEYFCVLRRCGSPHGWRS